MTVRALPILARDGFRLMASVYEPSAPARGVAVVAPATGVVRHFYHRFMAALAARGYLALAFDYRGIGESRPRTLRGFPATMRDWAVLDLSGILEWTSAAHPELPLALIGHSFGGQAIGLVAASRRPTAAVLIGAQHGYYRHWPVPRRYGLGVLVGGVIPALTATFGYLPSRWIRMGEDLPAGVAQEWARWCRTPTYLTTFDGHRSLDIPLLSVTASDDGFAPHRAVEALLAEYRAAKVTRRWVEPVDLGARSIGHFGYFRPSIASALWADIGDWLDGALAMAR